MSRSKAARKRHWLRWARYMEKYGCTLADWPGSFMHCVIVSNAADRAFDNAPRDTSEETYEGTHWYPWMATAWRWW